jgi:hypothetical protein
MINEEHRAAPLPLQLYVKYGLVGHDNACTVQKHEKEEGENK